MTEIIRTVRPGLLVSLNTSIRGNTQYMRQDLERAHVDETGVERAAWETTRIVTDPVEHEAAVKLRGKVRYLIQRVCVPMANHLLCPEEKASELLEAVAEARRLAAEFNENASLTNVSLSVFIGRVAQDDVQAVKAISSELRGLMDDMQQGLAKLDVAAVREAANKAKNIGEMLSPEAQARLEVAITAARQSARKLVKAGNVVGIEIDRQAIAKIDMARTSFLDFTDGAEFVAPTMDSRALDLEV